MTEASRNACACATDLSAAESPTLHCRVGRQLARDAWGYLLPVLPLTAHQMQKLLEYSASIPTGKTIGKRWRRCLDHKRGLWAIGEYGELSAEDQLKYPGEIAIHWYLPVVDQGRPGEWEKP